MKSGEYDLVVVGAGPAGSMAALTAAGQGLSVLLLEEHETPGTPLSCAEGISTEGLRRFFAPRPEWISSPVNGARLVSPDCTCVEVGWPGAGFILDRRVFDKDLCAMAAQAGATVRTRTPATGLLFEGSKVCGVTVRIDGSETRIRARVVIAADGAPSKVARWAGIATDVPSSELHLCAQFLLEHRTLDGDWAEFHLGRNLAPGGYAWVFPKGEHRANVGIGVTASVREGRSPLAYLRDFVEKRFPGAQCLGRMAGATPANNAPFPLASDNFMLVGDAARLTDPLSGAGIAIALGSGRLAAEIAVEAIRRGDTSRRRLMAYDREWRRRTGNRLELHRRIRKVFLQLTNDDLNKVAGLLTKLVQRKEPRDLDIVDLALVMIRSDPRLFLLGRHLLPRRRRL